MKRAFTSLNVARRAGVLALLLLAACEASTPSDPGSGGSSGGGGGGGGGGGSVTPPPSTTPTSIVLTPSSLTLTGAGSTGTIQAAVASAAGPVASPNVVWVSSAPGVATVTGSGASATVIAVAPGTSTITATAGSVSSQATVTVVPPTFVLTVSTTGTGRGRVTSTPGGIDCSSGATAGCSASYAQGTSVTLAAVPQGGSAFDGWQGSCSGSGACVVTADAARSVQASFRELPRPVSSVVVTPDSVVVPLNGTAQLVATTRASDGTTLTGRTVTWTSSNDAVVTVSASGVVTARGAGGPVEVRATSEGVTGVARVTVRSPFVTAKKLGVGWEHACAVEPDGALYCWGNNLFGRLGIGNVNSVTLGATQVGANLGWEDVDAGRDHTCARATTGVLYCWGGNAYGQVGDGTTSNRPNPTIVSGGVVSTQLSLGDESSCALAGGGTPYCWGANSNGFLATGTALLRVLAPAVSGGGISFASIRHDDDGSCGLTASGTAYCWGQGGSGRNGDSVRFSPDRSAPSRVSGSRTWISVSTSFFHSCGIAGTGEAFCWGANFYDALGTGDGSQYEYPVPVVTSQRFRSVTVGYQHSCALTATGEAWCWGNNLRGQLGDGTNVDRLYPTRVLTDVRFTQLIARAEHTCGIATTSVVYCWGRNNAGQLGTPASGGNTTPVAVPKP